MLLKFTFLIACLLTQQSRVSTLSKTTWESSLLGGEKWKIIGLYSVCSDLSNRTTFHDEALIYNKVADFVYGSQYDRNTVWEKHFGSPWPWNLNQSFYYQSFGICNKDDLVKVVLDLLLNETYFVNNKTQDPPLLNGQVIQKWKQQSNILFIASFLPENMVKILIEIAFSMVPIIVMNPVDSEPFSKYTNVKFPGSDDLSFKNLHFFLTKMLQTRSVVIILFGEEDKVSFDYKSLISLLKEEGKNCISFIAPENIGPGYQNTIDKLRRDNQDKTIVLIGNHIEQKEFLEMCMDQTLDDRIWFTDIQEYSSYFTLPNTTVYSTYKQRFYFRLKDSNRHYLSPLVDSTLTMASIYLDAFSHFESLTLYFALATLRAHLKPDHFKAHVMSTVPRNNAYMKYGGDDERSVFQNFLEVTKYSVKVKVDNACRLQQSCQPGWGKNYGKLLDNHTLWQTSYGWTCRKCEKNFYKSNVGDGPCKKCEGFNISRHDHSKCIDPFVSRRISIKMMSTKVSMSLSSFGAVEHITFLSCFIKYRKTPIVRSADATFTMLHIFTCVVIDIALPLLFLADPSYVICMCRPTAISVLFTISFSIVVAKSHKVVRAFSSNLKVTKTQIMMTSIVQWFVVMVMVLFGLAILLVTLVKLPANRNTLLNHGMLTKVVYCNTNFHIQCQVAYFIVLLMFCTMQAFRVRNLPGMFNEATKIGYASFTLTILFVVMFPIFHFQRNELDKSIVLWDALLISNILLIFILYGKRIWIILFRPQMNTKAFFRNEIMKDVKANLSTACRSSQAEPCYV